MTHHTFFNCLQLCQCKTYVPVITYFIVTLKPTWFPMMENLLTLTVTLTLETFPINITYCTSSNRRFDYVLNISVNMFFFLLNIYNI